MRRVCTAGCTLEGHREQWAHACALSIGRYTTIKSGRRRLLVPNSAFITREFMILDDALEPTISGRQPESGQAGSLGVRPEPTEWIRRSLESEPFHREQLPQYSAPQRYPYPDIEDDYSGGCAPRLAASPLTLHFPHLADIDHHSSFR